MTQNGVVFWKLNGVVLGDKRVVLIKANGMGVGGREDRKAIASEICVCKRRRFICS